MSRSLVFYMCTGADSGVIWMEVARKSSGQRGERCAVSSCCVTQLIRTDHSLSRQASSYSAHIAAVLIVHYAAHYSLMYDRRLYVIAAHVNPRRT